MLKGQKVGDKSGKYINCKLCGTPRYFYKYQLKLQGSLFCSRKCRTDYSKGKVTYFSKVIKKGICLNSGKTQFKKGMKAWNGGIHTGIAPWLGKKRSEEDKRKMSEGRKGLTSKENHPNWKGGVTPIEVSERARFRKQMQKLIFERDKFKCQICGSNKNLQVDHIAAWSEFKDLRFDPDNCRTLCMECHYKITYGKNKPDSIKNWGNNLVRRVAKFA